MLCFLWQYPHLPPAPSSPLCGFDSPHGAGRRVGTMWDFWAVSFCHKICCHFPLQHAIPSCLWKGLLAPLGITMERAAVCQPPPEPSGWAVVNLLLEEFPKLLTSLSLTFITWKPYHRWLHVSYLLNSPQYVGHMASLKFISPYKWDDSWVFLKVKKWSAVLSSPYYKITVFGGRWDEVVLALCLHFVWPHKVNADVEE